MMIPVQRPKKKDAEQLSAGDSLFLPFWKPWQVSPYLAYWKKKGLNMRTRVASMGGVWGTSIERKQHEVV